MMGNDNKMHEGSVQGDNEEQYQEHFEAQDQEPHPEQPQQQAHADQGEGTIPENVAYFIHTFRRDPPPMAPEPDNKPQHSQPPPQSPPQQSQSRRPSMSQTSYNPLYDDAISQATSRIEDMLSDISHRISKLEVSQRKQKNKEVKEITSKMICSKAKWLVYHDYKNNEALVKPWKDRLDSIEIYTLPWQVVKKITDFHFINNMAVQERQVYWDRATILMEAKYSM